MRSAREREHILRAAAEWNHVLNGHLRFEVEVAQPDGPPLPYRVGVWTILRATSDGLSRSLNRLENLAVTQLTPHGGLLLLFVDRLERFEIYRVALHKLGHVLGHDPDSRLMSALYTGSNQKCVGRRTVEMVAFVRNLPLAELNWCERPAVWPSG